MRILVQNAKQYRVPNLELIKDISELAVKCRLSWGEAEYIEELSRADSIQFVALKERVVLGFAVARLINPIGEVSDQMKFEEAEILDIGVEPNLQNKGVGNTLLQKTLEQCIVSGVKTVWLEVRESNYKAIRFYEKNNFFYQNTRPNYYHSPTENAWIMRRDLVRNDLPKT